MAMQFLFESSLVRAGHLQVASWAIGTHSAFLPQALGCSQGFLHLLFSQAAEDGQSLSVKQSPGLRQPVPTGSPTYPSEQTQVKSPSVFIHLAER